MKKLDQLVISTPRREKKGGQQVGCTDSGVVVELPGFIKIECRIHRAQIKNTRLARDLIELAVDDLKHNK